jgi:exonuclease VII large subunit
VAIGLARLPTMLTHQRQAEFYALARQDQTVHYVNRINDKTLEVANEFSALASTMENNMRGQQQALESLHAEINSALSSLQNELAATGATLRDVEARQQRPSTLQSLIRNRRRHIGRKNSRHLRPPVSNYVTNWDRSRDVLKNCMILLKFKPG